MIYIALDSPPSEEAPQLTAWLSQFVNELNNNFQLIGQYDPVYNMPTKISPGLVVYFGAAVLPDITAEGLWLYKSTGWQQL